MSPVISAVMSAETVYRMALRSYPLRWRQERAEEVLGVLMAAPDPTRGTLRESLSLVRHGLQERLSRSRRPGVWRSSTAAAAMAAATALAVTGVHGLVSLAGDAAYQAASGHIGGLYLDPLLAVFGLWLLTFVLLVVRRGRSAALAAWAAAAIYVGAVALTWAPYDDPAGDPMAGLEFAWDRLALFVPTLLLALLLLRPGTAARARDAVGGRVVATAFGVGTGAALLDVVGGISGAWPAVLALVVTLGSFALRGVSVRATVPVVLGFVYVPLGGLADGSGSRLPNTPVDLGLTLVLLPVLGFTSALLAIRLSDACALRGALAQLLDRAATGLPSDPPTTD